MKSLVRLRPSLGVSDELDARLRGDSAAPGRLRDLAWRCAPATAGRTRAPLAALHWPVAPAWSRRAATAPGHRRDWQLGRHRCAGSAPGGARRRARLLDVHAPHGLL